MSERATVFFNVLCGMGVWLLFLKYMVVPGIDHIEKKIRKFKMRK